MKLQDRHKEYAVKCYASFMQTSNVLDGFILKFWDDLSIHHEVQVDQNPDEYHHQMNKHLQDFREKLRHQLRRYDISHQEFPNKYRKLFDETRQKYVQSYVMESMQNSDSIVNELTALYGYVRQCIFGMTPSEKTIKNVQIAQKLLDSISAHKEKEKKPE